MSATFDEAMLTRPATKWRDAVTFLRDFALITFAIEPAKLAKHLPAGVEPDCFTLDDGREVAFISAVPFRDLGFHFVGLPFLRFSMGQINYRAYVKHAGKRCVWFFGTSLTGPTVAIPRFCWKLPWHGAKMSFQTEWQGDECLAYSLEAKSSWGGADAKLVGSGEGIGRLDGFADEEETRVVLTHPLKGLFHRRDGRLGSYSVWHDKLELQRGVVEHARFEVFEAHDLIDRDTKPHSVLVQRETEFIIQLPPKVVSS